VNGGLNLGVGCRTHQNPPTDVTPDGLSRKDNRAAQTGSLETGITPQLALPGNPARSE